MVPFVDPAHVDSKVMGVSASEMLVAPAHVSMESNVLRAQIHRTIGVVPARQAIGEMVSHV